jgi:hypothetical protein
MMKKIFCLLSLIPVIFISCEPSLFSDILFRTVEDPFYDCPITDSLSLENTIYLKWSEDEACDEFILLRSYDQNNLDFKSIYEGNKTSYVDRNIEENCNYIYRLDKRRGEKIFRGKEYSYGYGASCRKDFYEPNDTENEAIFLEYDLVCNIPVVKYITDDAGYFDEDWFYITIPPKRTAEILVSQKNLENTTTGSNTNLKIQQKGATSQPVGQMSAINISNTTNETKDYYFKIFANTTDLFTGSKANTVIEYTISLSRIYNYKL